MITNNDYAKSVTERTMKAIEKIHKDQIDYIKKRIEETADKAETSVEITQDEIDDILKIGAILKQYFLYNGFDTKFIFGDCKIAISWKIEKPKQMLNSYSVNYL
jgi:predicted RNase H-like nuclease